MKKFISAVLSCIMLAFSLSIGSYAASEKIVTVNNITYSIRENAAYVSSVSAVQEGYLELPYRIYIGSESASSITDLDEDDNDIEDPFDTDYVYVRGIDAGAFDAVEDQLTSLGISKYIQDIDIDSLRTSNLQSILLAKANAFYSANNGMLLSKDGTELILSPRMNPNDIPDTVTEIDEYAFLNNYAVKQITLPSGVSEIKNSVFRNCPLLESVVFNDNLKVIGNYAFAQCKSLQSVQIPAGVTNIGQWAFYGCTALESADFGGENSALSSIGECAFLDCLNLKSVTVYRGVTNIGEYAFGFYIDDDAVRQYVDGFAITGYKRNAEKTAYTDIYNYSVANSVSFIPLDPTYALTFYCGELNGRNSAMILKSGVNTYTVSSSNGVFTIGDEIEPGVYAVYFEGEKGLRTLADETITCSGNVYELSVRNDVINMPIGDVNADGIIDVNDVSDTISCIGGSDSQYDVDGDGVVDISDISVILQSDNYGKIEVAFDENGI